MCSLLDLVSLFSSQELSIFDAQLIFLVSTYMGLEYCLEKSFMIANGIPKPFKIHHYFLGEKEEIVNDQLEWDDEDPNKKKFNNVMKVQEIFEMNKKFEKIIFPFLFYFDRIIFRIFSILIHKRRCSKTTQISDLKLRKFLRNCAILFVERKRELFFLHFCDLSD